MTRRQSNNQGNDGIAAHPAPPPKKNSERINPLEKLSSRFFLGSRRHLLIDYLPKGQTIKAEYYSTLLVQFKDILKETRRGKFTNGVLFLHDNAPVHRALATQKKLAFHFLDHPPYSPDRAPSDYHLLPGLKKTIFFRSGGHCSRGDLVGRTTFRFFLSGLRKLEQWAKKYIELLGNYVE